MVGLQVWGLSDWLTVGAGCFSDWLGKQQATHGACRQASRPRPPRLACRRSASAFLGLGLAAVTPILQLQVSKARAVFAYRSALDPRENGEHTGVLVSD